MPSAVFDGVVLSGMRVAASDSPAIAREFTRSVGDESIDCDFVAVSNLRTDFACAECDSRAGLAAAVSAGSVDSGFVCGDHSVWDCQELAFTSL
jgi:hypothetical protein